MIQPSQHNIRSVSACRHCNRGCHGCSPAAATAAAGVPGEQFATIDKALDARTIGHNPERLSLLQGGIVYANQVLSCVFSHKAKPTMIQTAAAFAFPPALQLPSQSRHWIFVNISASY